MNFQATIDKWNNFQLDTVFGKNISYWALEILKFPLKKIIFCSQFWIYSKTLILLSSQIFIQKHSWNISLPIIWLELLKYLWAQHSISITHDSKY